MQLSDLWAGDAALDTCGSSSCSSDSSASDSSASDFEVSHAELEPPPAYAAYSLSSWPHLCANAVGSCALKGAILLLIAISNSVGRFDVASAVVVGNSISLR